MKKQTKQFIFWAVIALLAITVIIVVKNWDAFINGFSVGGNVAE